MEHDEAGRAAPLLDVYAAAVPPGLSPGEVCSPARARLLAQTRDSALKRQRWLAWHLLEFAAAHSLGLDPKKLVFTRDASGRWSCPDFAFSLSHTDGAVAVAVSRTPVGVDVESLPLFRRRFASDPAACAKILRRIAAGDELAGSEGREAETLLRLWTGKESLFKARQADCFIPTEIRYGPETRHLLLDLPPQAALAVSSEQLSALRVFAFAEEAVTPAAALPFPADRFL